MKLAHLQNARLQKTLLQNALLQNAKLQNTLAKYTFAICICRNIAHSVRLRLRPTIPEFSFIFIQTFFVVFISSEFCYGKLSAEKKSLKFVHFPIIYWCNNFRLSFTMFPTSCWNQYSDVLFSQNYYHGWFFWSNTSHLDVSWSGKCKFFVYFYRIISSRKDWQKKIIISTALRIWSDLSN